MQPGRAQCALSTNSTVASIQTAAVIFLICHARTRTLGSMAKSQTIGLSYAALRKECLDAVRQWPGCETVSGIQIIRDNTPGGFSVRVTLYGKANERIADRAMVCVQREKRRQFHLTE